MDPSSARYLYDPDEIFWFMQISDSHIGAELGYGSLDTDSLSWAVNEAVETVLPEFVVLTGDIVDATNGWLIPTQQYQEEWDAYLDIVEPAGMEVSFFHDIAGNHDTYRDEGASYYLANTVAGQAYGELHEAWSHGFDFGEYLFVGLNSADTSGPYPLFDSPGLAESELDFLEESLLAWQDASLAFVFTHHPHHSLEYGEDELASLLAEHGVSVWANGHDHSHNVSWYGDTLELTLDTLGKGSSENIGLWAVDHDGVAGRACSTEDWPFVLISAPTDASLGGGNPHAYVISQKQTANPVRALVFDAEEVLEVFFMVDGGESQPMEEVAPSVWQGSWDCSVEESGLHTLEVWANTQSGANDHSIEVELAVTECDDGVDNDGNGYTDHDEDGGCWGASDDDESGWEPGPEDSGLDDTGAPGDSAPPDDSPGDDTGLAPEEDQDSGLAQVAIGRGQCGCGGGYGAGGLLALSALLLAQRRRRRAAAQGQP